MTPPTHSPLPQAASAENVQLDATTALGTIQQMQAPARLVWMDTQTAKQGHVKSVQRTALLVRTLMALCLVILVNALLDMPRMMTVENVMHALKTVIPAAGTRR